MKKTHNVFRPRAISDAVLSHRRQKTGNQLRFSGVCSFYQADHHPQIVKQGRSSHLRRSQHNVAQNKLHLLR